MDRTALILNPQDIWNRQGAMVEVTRIGPRGDVPVVLVILAIYATAAFIFRGGN